MQYRFIIQKNRDGTMSADCATVCEVLKEQNWLHQDEAPYLMQLKTFESMKRDMFPYLTDPGVFEVPVGSIEFVEAYLRKMYGIEKMVPLLVPSNKDGLLDFFEDQKTLQITGRHSISYERILVCNGYLLDNDNVFDQADSISGDLCRVAEAICGRNGEILSEYQDEPAEKALFLDKLWVNPGFRNRGVATLFLKSLPKLVSETLPPVCGVYGVVVPWELKLGTPEHEAEKERLLKFYLGLGFQRVGQTDVIWMPVE